MTPCACAEARVYCSVQDMSCCVEGVEVLDTLSGQLLPLTPGDLNFGYRCSSVLQRCSSPQFDPDNGRPQCPGPCSQDQDPGMISTTTTASCADAGPGARASPGTPPISLLPPVKPAQHIITSVVLRFRRGPDAARQARQYIAG